MVHEGWMIAYNNNNMQNAAMRNIFFLPARLSPEGNQLKFRSLYSVLDPHSL